MKNAANLPPKSSIHIAFVKDPYLGMLLLQNIPCFTPARAFSIDVILDFIRLPHQPLPPGVFSLPGFIYYLWEKSVWRLRFSRGAGRVTAVIESRVSASSYIEQAGKGLGWRILNNVENPVVLTLK